MTPRPFEAPATQRPVRSVLVILLLTMGIDCVDRTMLSVLVQTSRAVSEGYPRASRWTHIMRGALPQFGASAWSVHGCAKITSPGRP